MNLPQSIIGSILDLARQCNLDRVILFGFCARGDNQERSDIDLAVHGGDTMAFAASADADSYPAHVRRGGFG